MRSVAIYFSNLTTSQVTGVLRAMPDAYAQSSGDFNLGNSEHPWASACVTETVIEADDEYLSAVKFLPQGEPVAIVVADVSGRAAFKTEVHEFVKSLLFDNDAVAQDDYSSYAWKFEEIGIVNSEGREFFATLDGSD